LFALNMRSDWFFLVLITFRQMLHCRQRPTRKPGCGTETARSMSS